MARQLSSSWTFICKYVFPAVWITGCGLAPLGLLRDPVAYDALLGAAPPGAEWMFLAGWVAGSAFILWVALPLKRVRVAEGALWVSNYWRETRVPFGFVAEVRQNRWITVRPVSVRLQADLPGLGHHFTFMPRTRPRRAFWREDREVAELRQLAGLRSGSDAPAM